MGMKYRSAPGHIAKGDYVRRKGQVARVQALFSDVEGGLKLDRQIDGFSCWNVKDVRRVEPVGANLSEAVDGQDD